jgi:hypothetical protein
MSETQSFVETTLPPGYAWTDWPEGEHIRWECGGVVGQWFAPDRTAECYRSAWSHWTATVLRGRRVHWMRTQDGRLIASANDTDIRWEPTTGLHELGVDYRDVDRGWDRLPLASVSDPDEAMARFAALVLATEGMVPR